jgi:hypothetical protein
MTFMDRFKQGVGYLGSGIAYVGHAIEGVAAPVAAQVETEVLEKLAADAKAAAPVVEKAIETAVEAEATHLVEGAIGTAIALLLCVFLTGVSSAQDKPSRPTSMQLSPATREWYRNPDGSCVQCSIGMVGVHANNPAASTLLWDSDYGPAVRGGSTPSRVECYCDERGIRGWSVTGATPDDTIPWMHWAARTGRFAAIGAGTRHFQTLYGYDPTSERPWMVCNNNSPQRIDRYTEREFRQLHAAVPWVVILEMPSSDPPRLVAWWK